MPIPFSPSCPVVPVSPSNSSTDEITPPVSSNVQSDSSSGPESDTDIERGPQPTPDQGAWKSFLDANGDGTISSRDLVAALFLVGATLSVAEFEELHKKVQVDSGAFSKFVVTNEGPEALQKRYLNEEKLYLEGTWPSRQFKTIMMLSYVFLLPMLNIDWPIRLVEAKNVTDIAWIKTMKVSEDFE
ncbi:hypothetical protein TrVE_jg6907 [Triparma verrucosa]|uniref:EF-hand domain-containing protein n=1 Tax=Triparma verrucosa TaxID=1606542 RepID=A0A9W7BAS9_9STRA|nr:hypothetical protein TrVE_jg6907 [Triparma verrucosa]